MKRLIVIVGPTAIGKTAMAIKVAQMFNTEIVSCDSRQFYKELNIGVARPSYDELSAVKHHFIANRSVIEPYNVSQYEHEAVALLDGLFARYDDVVAVGGSGLYVDALCVGMAIMPDPTPELRKSLKEQIAVEGLDSLCRLLKEKDPLYYAQVDLHNPVRVQRALEVIAMTGRPYSDVVSQCRSQRPFSITKIGLFADREALRQRIDQRVDMMIDAGLENEVRNCIPYRDLNTLNTVGYKEMFDCFDGRLSRDESIRDIKVHTWRYAKKQMTWLKRYSEITWCENNNINQVVQAL